VVASSPDGGGRALEQARGVEIRLLGSLMVHCLAAIVRADLAIGGGLVGSTIRPGGVTLAIMRV
jgi:hypothetical protein